MQVENDIIKNIPLLKLECTISYTYNIKEPNFAEYNNYPQEKVFPSTYSESYFSEEIYNYESKLLLYNITISEDLSTVCDDGNCLLCRASSKLCIICKYNYILHNF